MWYTYSVYIYVNGKVRTVETIPGMGREKVKENDGGVNSIMIYCKNFYKCHNVPPAQQFKKCKNELKETLFFETYISLRI
jgi:hypothetical protein